MADKKFGGSRFLMLGAAYWLVVAAIVGIAHHFWPDLADSGRFVIAMVFGVVIAGFIVVYLFRPK